MKIPTSSIHIRPNRVRKDLGDIDELADSIQRTGLIEPIVVDDNNYLVAGLRRFIAIQKLEWSEVDVFLRKDLDPILAKQIELEENIRRKQLTWSEEVTAKKILHDLMREIHGAAVQGKEGGWGIEKTANLLGQSIGLTHLDVQLAECVEQIPEIAEAPGKKAAYILWKKLRERAILAERARRARGEGSSETLPYQLFNVDCIPALAALPPNSIDLIVTDPPYGISYDEVRANRPEIDRATEFVDDVVETARVWKNVALQLFRVAKEGSHIYVFGAYSTHQVFVDALHIGGWTVRPHPLVWVKVTPTPGQVAAGGFMNLYELIIFGYKGHMKPLRETASDVFSYAAPRTRIHATQKPVELLQRLITLSSEEGELVLDPFAGSASTLVAATLAKRRSVGFEIDEQCYGAAVMRLKGFSKEEVEAKDDDEDS